jgi:ParB family chromosome partitioning protein
MRRLTGQISSLTDEEQTSYETLRAEFDQLEETYAQADELPKEVDQRFGEIETALVAFENRPSDLLHALEV